MRTDRPDRPPGPPPDEPIEPPLQADEVAGPSPAARAGTIAFFVAIGLVVWVLASRGSGDPEERRGSAPAVTPAGTLPAGTYRLPGLTVPVSITVPEGWSAGGAFWGSTSRGVAAITTGEPGEAISIAVLDLDALRPVDPSTDEALAHPADDAWFRRSHDVYEAAVAPRVRDRVVGSQVDWKPPPVLAWLLTFTDRGPVAFADGVVYDDRSGDLASFAFPGPRRTVFRTDDGAIDLRPGVTYTFWIPLDPGVPRVVLGVARELGAVPGTAEWDVVRTLDLDG